MAITLGCVRDHHICWVPHDGGGRQPAGACKNSEETILPEKQPSFFSNRHMTFLVGDFDKNYRVVTSILLCLLTPFCTSSRCSVRDGRTVSASIVRVVSAAVAAALVLKKENSATCGTIAPSKYAAKSRNRSVKRELCISKCRAGLRST